MYFIYLLRGSIASAKRKRVDVFFKKIKKEAEMKINIMQITERGMQYSSSEEDWILEAVDEALDGTVKECSAQIELDRYSKRVEARIRYLLVGTISCSRCAQDIEVSFSGAEVLLFDPKIESQEEEVELHVEDLDIGWYDDGKLDLKDVVCESVVLSFPDRVHCFMDVVRVPASGGCYTPPQKEERTLENMFADLLKKQ